MKSHVESEYVCPHMNNQTSHEHMHHTQRVKQCEDKNIVFVSLAYAYSMHSYFLLHYLRETRTYLLWQYTDQDLTIHSALLYYVGNAGYNSHTIERRIGTLFLSAPIFQASVQAYSNRSV